jgi:hypothetical protein
MAKVRWAKEDWAVLGLGMIALGVAVMTVVVAVSKPPNALAAGLLQAITLVLGVSASYLFGRRSARNAAEQIISPHAKSAFRRVLSLFQAFGRLRESVEVLSQEIGDKAESDQVSVAYVELALKLLRTQILEQIGTANDAMEDWRDMVPDEVAVVEGRVLVDVLPEEISGEGNA